MTSSIVVLSSSLNHSSGLFSLMVSGTAGLSGEPLEVGGEKTSMAGRPDAYVRVHWKCSLWRLALCNRNSFGNHC